MSVNEFLWAAMLAFSFGAVLAAYRLFGRIGLYIWIPLSTIIANIQVLKVIEVFGFEATLGNIVYAATFLVTDLLSETEGRRAAAKAVNIGFFSLFTATFLLNMALWFSPSPSDTAHGPLSAIFSVMPRISLASVLAYGLSQFHDIHAYHFWKQRFPSAGMLWLRNNASTMVSQLIDSGVFVAAAFAGVLEQPVLLEIFGTTCILKFAVAALDTPFLYLGKRMADARSTGT